MLPREVVRTQRTARFVAQGAYLPMIRRMAGAGMLTLKLERGLARYPKHLTNGMFAIPKSGAQGGQQFIVDCRSDNAHLPPPENPALPDRGAQGELLLGAGPDDAVMGVTDIPCYLLARGPEMAGGSTGSAAV